MKSGIALYVVGLFVLAAPLGCGGDTEIPANNKVVVPRIDRAGAPGNLVVTPADSQVALKWTAPTEDGGSRILGYTAWIFEEGKAARSQALKSTETSATITGLTNGTAYAFAVAATNSLGDGAMTERSASVKPRTIPGLVRDLTSVAGDRQGTLSWTAPEATGMPVVSYTVTVLRGVDDVEVETKTVTETQATFTGLSNGTAYEAYVIANNVVTSGPLARALAFTPRTVPGLPQVQTEVSASRTSITLTMSLSDSGGTMTWSYLVRAYQNGALYRTVSTGDSTYTIDVTAGATYTFVVAAVNDAGEGPATEPIEVKP